MQRKPSHFGSYTYGPPFASGSGTSGTAFASIGDTGHGIGSCMRASLTATYDNDQGPCPIPRRARNPCQDSTMTHAPEQRLYAGIFVRSDLVVLGLAIALTAAAGLTHAIPSGAVVPFFAAAGAVAVLASLVGRSVEQLGDRFGPGATGALQSALGNLPELFIALFALRAGLVTVVQSALIGSILANLLLVLGMAFIVGGIKHGTQKLDSKRRVRSPSSWCCRSVPWSYRRWPPRSTPRPSPTRARCRSSCP